VDALNSAAFFVTDSRARDFPYRIKNGHSI